MAYVHLQDYQVVTLHKKIQQCKKSLHFSFVLLNTLNLSHYDDTHIVDIPAGKRAHDVIMTSSLRPNDVADVVLT